MATYYLRRAARDAVDALEMLTAEQYQSAADNPELTALLEVKRRVAIDSLRRAVDGYEERD